MTGPSLAVVVVTHNSGHAIAEWIDALETTGRRAEMEVCVVDSGSTPAESALLSAAVVGRVDALYRCPNLGYGGSCNVGAARTTAPVLLFTNPDTRVRSLPHDLDRATAGRAVGAFRLTEDDGRKPLGFASYPTARFEIQELALGRWRRGIERTADEPAWVSGAALLMSRMDFERLDGFSSELFMYFEDADLCARHRALGGTVSLDPRFLIEHDAGKSSVVEDRDKLESSLDSVNRLSARIFAARHGRAWHRAGLYALLVVAYVPRRIVVALLGRRGRPRRVASYVLDLLAPKRALRRLGAPDARRAGH